MRENALLGVPFPAVLTDVSSCYPLIAHLCGWWDLMCAESIRRRTVTAALRRLCERAITDPTVVLDPAVWQRFGFTLAEVLPDGESFPIEVEDEHRPDGRLEVVPVWSPKRSLFYPWPYVVGAAVRSSRVPRIVRAVRLEPIGRQASMRTHLPCLPGVTLHADEDPVLALVRARRDAKRTGDRVQAAELHAVINSLTFGIFGRFDDIYRRHGRRYVKAERPGPWNCMPIASTVSAGAHLFLAVFDRLVAERGTVVAYRDTDSSIVPATRDGGVLNITSGVSVRALSWQEIDEIVSSFAPLSPELDWEVWKTERGLPNAPLQALVLAPKRHVEYIERDGQIEIVHASEAQLGGTCIDPACMPGRTDEGQRVWSITAIEREIHYAIARQHDPDHAIRSPARWDPPDVLPFPELRRRIVKTAEQAGGLPAALGARLGTRYIEGVVSDLHGAYISARVALDPGGDLADWHEILWTAYADCEPTNVTTDPRAHAAVLLKTLDTKATRWSRRSPVKPIGAVIVNEVQHLGRVSPVIDADADGDQQPAEQRIRYGAATSTPTQRSSPTCAANDCQRDVTRTGASYCSPRCRERAKKQRHRKR